MASAQADAAPKSPVIQAGNVAYRADLDGLRAFVLIPMILFHAGYAPFEGGFAGLDVFYVISGFLITSILIKDLEKERFSLVVFYERRARRLMPALFVVILACLPFAWVWMTPGQLRDFSESVVAVSLFVSNIHFWFESGYFAAAAEEKPFLHTWSLAVEEQYYLVFPVFLFLIWRLGRRGILWCLAGISVISLALAEWGWRNEPVANYYLSPTRAWELMAGSICAFIVHKHGLRPNQILAALGLAMITFSLAVYDSSTPFPSLYALVPVIGTVLLVLFAGTETYAGRLLAIPPLVGVGLISYSGYLWHQPLFAFARVRWVGDEPVWLYPVLIAATLGLSILSWRFVEQPFRDRKAYSRGFIFAASGAGLAGFVAIGLVGALQNGFPNRLPPDELAYYQHFDNSPPAWQYSRTRVDGPYGQRCNSYNNAAMYQSRATNVPLQLADDCTTPDPAKGPSVMLWGDSHTLHLRPGLEHALGPNRNLLQLSTSDCPPTLVDGPSQRDYCQMGNFLAMQTAQEAVPQVVVLARQEDHDVAEILEIKDWLQAQGVARVVLMGPVPQWNPALPERLLAVWPNLPERTWHGVETEGPALDARLKAAFADVPGLTYVSVIDLLCDPDEGCLVTVNGDFTEGLTAWDYGHFTLEGSRHVIDQAIAAHPGLFDVEAR